MNNILEISNLSKKISNKFEIKNLSFELKKGYVTGLIGSNGAGKTSLIKLIMGLYKKDNGSIKIFDMELEDNETMIKQRIGYVADTPHYIEKMSLEKNAKLIKPFYPDWDEDLFNKYINFFELDSQKYFSELSKGMKIKFALTMALSHNPDLLILDEPTAGIDPIFRREILDLLYDFVSDSEKSVLISTHITSDLDKIADYLIFMDEGEIVMNGIKDYILSSYSIVKGSKEQLSDSIKQNSLSYKLDLYSFESLVKMDDIDFSNTDNLSFNKPTIEDIMFFYKKSKTK